MQTPVHQLKTPDIDVDGALTNAIKELEAVLCESVEGLGFLDVDLSELDELLSKEDPDCSLNCACRLSDESAPC